MQQSPYEYFFQAVDRVSQAYTSATFHYVATFKEGKFVVLQSRLLLNTGNPAEIKLFSSKNVIAGSIPISDLKLTPEKVVSRLLDGELAVPNGKIFLPQDFEGKHTHHLFEFHPEGVKNQSRICVLRIVGDTFSKYISQPSLDWELRAATTPYDDLQDLYVDHRLGVAESERLNFEVAAFNVAVVEFASPVSGMLASPRVRLADKLDTSLLRLSYKIFSGGKVVNRSSISGEQMSWKSEEDYLLGEAKIEIPAGAVLQCFVIYENIVQHWAWLADTSATQNSRRAIYQTFDPDLQTLKDIVAQARGRSVEARNLEAAIAWILWMLGFSPAHLGGTPRTQEAADLVVSSPSGNFAIVECTTGLLKSENKLSLLNDRAVAVRRALDAANGRHHKLLPVIVTSKSKSEVQPDIEQAERWGILVLTRENLDNAIQRSGIQSNADQIFDDAFKKVEADRKKYEAVSNIENAP